MVKVKPTELKNKISVKTSVETNVFSIKDNLSEFYAKQAENWAHSEGMVNGLDYSSKYYAEQSKISAENSQKIGNIIQENYNSFMDLSSSANMELQEVKGEVIDSIGASKQDAIDSIETSKQDVINDINSTKTTILNDIEFVAEGEKQEIGELADVIKDNANTIINRVGFNMFDTILKDHVLTYEESKGLALQGTWVYKTAIAGERFGYPDFYNKCLEEYRESKKVSLDVTTVGTLNITDDGTVSGFSSSNYMKYPTTALGANFELGIKITTGSDILTSQVPIVGSANPVLAFGALESGYPEKFGYNIGDGTNWKYGTGNNSGHITVKPNTTYYLKMVCADGWYRAYVSTDNLNWELDWEKENNLILPDINGYIGVGRILDGKWLGSLDISEWYINVNGERVWNGGLAKTHKNGHSFYSIDKKIRIDTIFNSTGMAWMYGIDQENERIFLPRNVWFEQMSMDDVGKAIEAGLPNITGGFKVIGSTDPWVSNVNADGTGALYDRIEVSGKQYYASVINNTNSNTHSTGLDASLSNPIYGNSNTVQPNAVKKLLYICVGNTVSDTSWVDVVTQVEGGVKDLEDKKNTIIAEIDANAKSYDNLTKRQITNCLLEIPQRIKLELADGVLTLKAGSEVIVPNGFEADGATPKFDEVVIENDWSKNAPSMTNRTDIVWVPFGVENVLYTLEPIVVLSGATATIPSGQRYALWYDTTNNIVKFSDDSGATWTGGQSLPIGIVSSDNTKIASIDQVFNGMGYIGSTIWVDKGVKGLIPNGRNEDGSLNNVEFITDKLLTLNVADSNRPDLVIFMQKNNTLLAWGRDGGYVTSYKTKPANPSSVYQRAYIESENTWYHSLEQAVWLSQDNSDYITELFSVATGNNNTVTSLTPKQPFRAVDYNDFNDLSNGVTTLQKGVGSANAYLIQTYSSGTSWYRIWSNGWCEQGGRIQRSGNTTTIRLLHKYTNTNYNIQCTMEAGSGNRYAVSIVSRTASSFGAYCVHTEPYYHWRTCGWKA